MFSSSSSSAIKPKLNRLGRAVLWLTVAILLIRGLGSIVASPDTGNGASTDPIGPVFPAQQEAEAFAANFLTNYLTYSPGKPESYINSLEGTHSLPEPNAGFSVPDEGPTQSVNNTAVSSFTALDANRARVVLSANVITTPPPARKQKGDARQEPVSTIQYWTVNVARSKEGGLTVYQYPSRTGPPPGASVTTSDLEEPSTEDQSDMMLLMAQFFEAYFSGKTEPLTGYVATGTQLVPVPSEMYELDSVVSILQPKGSPANRRNLTVKIRVYVNPIPTSGDTVPQDDPNQAGTMPPETDKTSPTQLMTYSMATQRIPDGRWVVSAINPK